MDRGQLRAGDADRDRVAERLRIALEEGRLNLHEYDERLRDAYAAKTYADLDGLLADLPNPVPASQSALEPAGPGTGALAQWRYGPDGRYLRATRRWLADRWGGWAGAVAICVGIWAFQSLVSGDLIDFWPRWVAGPWGVLLLAGTVHGLLTGEPQRWAAKQARKEAEREVRRRAEDRDD